MDVVSETSTVGQLWPTPWDLDVSHQLRNEVFGKVGAPTSSLEMRAALLSYIYSITDSWWDDGS